MLTSSKRVFNPSGRRMVIILLVLEILPYDHLLYEEGLHKCQECAV